MTPFSPDAKNKMMEAAAKAFPKKTAEQLESEFSEMMSLEVGRFQRESGDLTPQEETRLEQLQKQFSPAPGK